MHIVCIEHAYLFHLAWLYVVCEQTIHTHMLMSTQVKAKTLDIYGLFIYKIN